MQKSISSHRLCLFVISLSIAFLFTGCTANKNAKTGKIIKIIFDTDLGPDYDDVGALAFLHAMDDSGKVKILATVASNRHHLVAPSIDVINTYFGRGDVLVGAPKSAGVSMTASQHWPDSIREALLCNSENACTRHGEIYRGPDDAYTGLKIRDKLK